jgi:hypothetical protein
MEQGKRIELSASAWKAEVLPLYEPCFNFNYRAAFCLINFGGLNENRTRPYGVTGHYTHRYTMRPKKNLL